MSKRVLYDLKDMLCAELDEIGKKGEMSAGFSGVIWLLWRRRRRA